MKMLHSLWIQLPWEYPQHCFVCYIQFNKVVSQPHCVPSPALLSSTISTHTLSPSLGVAFSHSQSLSIHPISLQLRSFPTVCWCYAYLIDTHTNQLPNIMYATPHHTKQHYNFEFFLQIKWIFSVYTICFHKIENKQRMTSAKNEGWNRNLWRGNYTHCITM